LIKHQTSSKDQILKSLGNHVGTTASAIQRATRALHQTEAPPIALDVPSPNYLLESLPGRNILKKRNHYAPPAGQPSPHPATHQGQKPPPNSTITTLVRRKSKPQEPKPSTHQESKSVERASRLSQIMATHEERF
jgi:hypothetical protein